MANRVTSDEVKEIIDTSLTNINPFITAANLVVTKHLASNTDFSVDELKEIERWLSAHFVAIRDPTLEDESVDKSKVKYSRGKLGENLNATHYGQQVLILDHSGVMVSIGKVKPTIGIIDTSSL